MATIRKRDGIRGVTYDVQIRIRPHPHVTASFKKLTDAKRWAEKTEAEMRANRYGMVTEARKRTLSEAIARYRQFVLPEVKKSRREHLVNWWEDRFGHLSLKDITAALVIEIRDKMVQGMLDGKKRSPSTIFKYLITLSHILSKCVEWEWMEVNPVMKVSKPTLPKGRSRFLDDAERERLLKACKESSNPYLYTIVILAISTGMRRSELITLRYSAVDLERGRIVLHETKNGDVRVLPLVGLAHQLLKEMSASKQSDSDLIFPGTDPKRPIDFRSAWDVAIKKSGIVNFNFHDLRHSFASYCVMNGSTLNEVADLLGHKSFQSVTKRYCHLSDAYRKDVVTSMNEKIFGGSSEK